jgi:alkanesulfonate monooxygenase SsuD/methylene tetrahydromethanopterin reductase-like flavin-dependent oxidoreductase (luciferase family)
MTGHVLGAAIPDTAAGQVEFVSLTGYNPGSELNGAARGGAFDLPFYRRYVAALEEAGFDYTLNGYGSSTADSFVVSAATGQLTERLKPIVALRPNHTFPLVAAQKLATLDQLTRGRAVVHLISGGFDAEQRKHGDYEPKARRYAGGASTALVGSYETVVAAILDQVDAGASIVSIRGFDTLNDVVDYGRHLLPLVRQEIAHRQATGQRGDLQRNASGFDRADFLAAHDAAASAAANAAETAPAAR